MNFTRREKHFLIAAALLALYFIITHPVYIPEDQETFYLIFIVAPLGFYLASDPEKGREGIK